MSPFRTAADMPGFADLLRDEPPAASLFVPVAKARLPDDLSPPAHWWQRMHLKVRPAMGLR